MDAQTHFIAHCADIHIGSGKRSQEYRAVFDRFAASIKHLTPAGRLLTVVIAGDIFHHKTRYNGQDVADFNYLISTILSVSTPPPQIVIVPGNHDTNLNNQTAPSAADLIEPLVTRINSQLAAAQPIHYLTKTGLYTAVAPVPVFYLDMSAQTALPNITPMNPRPVLIYHGIVNGAKYGSFTESARLVTKEFMANFSACLLGDIHESQFVTPTAAYSGSLIQQNLGESTRKGYIFWQITGDRAEPTFVPLHNDHAFLRLDLRGRSAEEIIAEIKQAPPTVLLKVSAVADPASAHVLDAVRAAIPDLPVSQVTMVDHRPVVVEANDTIAVLRDHLQSMPGLHPDVIEDALALATDCAATTYTCTRWTLKSLSFDNMFKYGAGNFIDFTRWTRGQNIAGVIAANTAGKSSIIDILVFALFNEHLRADNKSIVRNGAKSARVEVEFEVDGMAYRLARTMDRVRHTSHSLHRRAQFTPTPNSDDPAAPPTATWENITEANITQTYQKMESLIGSSSKFLSINAMLGPQHDIFHMGRADRLRALPELFGMTNNEKTLSELKTSAKQLAAELAKIPKHRYDPTTQIAEAEAQIAQLRAEQSAVEADIESAERAVQALQAETPLPTRQQSVVLADIAAAASSLSKLEAAATTLEGAAPAQTQTPAELAAQIAEAQRELSRLPPAAKLQSFEAELLKLGAVAQLDLPTAPPDTALKEAAVLRQTVAQLARDISAVRFHKIDDTPVGRAQRAVKQAADCTRLSFSQTCQCCADNKIVLAADLLQREREFEAAKKHHEDQLAENIAAKELSDALAAKQSMAREQLAAVESRIAALQTAAAAKQLQTQIEGARAATALQTRVAALAAEHQAATRAAQIATALAELRAKIHTARADIARLEAELERSKSPTLEKLTTLRAALTRGRARLAELIAQIATGVAKLGQHAEERRLMETYLRDAPPIEKRLAACKALVAGLSSSDLKTKLLRRNVDRLVETASSILSAVQGSKDSFRIRAAMDSSAVDFTIGVQGPTDTIELPARLASGYQKFICAAALRIAMTTITSAAADFIFIDEGFGSVDEVNQQMIIDELPKLVSHLSFAFIISHIAELQSMIREPLAITTVFDAAVGANVSHVSSPAAAPTPDTTKGQPATQPAVARKARAPVKAKEVAADAAGEPAADTVQCECSAVIKKSSRAAHEKTAKHIKLMEQKNK
jgi:DNA repair exonuclease SbcCD ATPase subunit/DNA repair exonuclease SbcCD nuclease subunit